MDWYLEADHSIALTTNIKAARGCIEIYSSSSDMYLATFRLQDYASSGVAAQIRTYMPPDGMMAPASFPADLNRGRLSLCTHLEDASGEKF